MERDGKSMEKYRIFQRLFRLWMGSINLFFDRVWMKPKFPTLHISVRCSKSNEEDVGTATTEIKGEAPADFSHSQG